MERGIFGVMVLTSLFLIEKNIRSLGLNWWDTGSFLASINPELAKEFITAKIT